MIKPWFLTEGKLAAIFIKPSLGVSNWPVILLHQQTQSSSLTPSIPRHQAAKSGVHWFGRDTVGFRAGAREMVHGVVSWVG
jgi:hypothetical protein